MVETVQAPPAVVFLQALQCQMPTAVRLTESCLFKGAVRQSSGAVPFMLPLPAGPATLSLALRHSPSTVHFNGYPVEREEVN